MTPQEQAAAVRLLRRWRDLCLDADRNARDGRIEDDTAALTLLFLETDAFLSPAAPSGLDS